MSKVLCFTWNTQSNRLGESLDKDIIEEHRNSYLSAWKYPCIIPDFFVFMKNKILESRPNFVCFSLQEDVKPGSYFHSHLLPEEMPKIGYKLIYRSSKMGVGKTSYQGLSDGDLFMRGIRISVYGLAEDDWDYQPKEKHFVNSIFQNKAATAIYLTGMNEEGIAFINLHSPFDSSSLNETVLKKDEYIRQTAVFDQNKFFNGMTRTLVKEAPIDLDYVFCMGDLNYRYFPFAKWSADLTGQIILSLIKSDEPIQELRANDELRVQMAKFNIYNWDEGVNNIGPKFFPTCKMLHSRKAGSHTIKDYSLGRVDQRVPSHCDRILYLTENKLKFNVTCLEYDRFDVGTMVNSDHAGVYSSFFVNKIC